MPDNKNISGPLDAKRINIQEAHELQYWSKQLGISTDQLIEAVNSVGTSVEAVKRKLSK